MKNLFVFLLIGLSFQYTVGQDQILPIWPEGIPCENDLTIDIKDDERIGRVISKVHTPEIHAYFPDKDKSNGSAIMICPGGGYRILAWDWEGTKMAEWFNEMGVAAFVLKYRLPHWESEQCRDEVALMDAQRAMRMVRSHATKWGIKTNQIGIMGFSAGGHLASSTITHFDAGKSSAKLEVERHSSRPDFAILMYPVITMDTTFAHMGSRTNLIGKNPTKERASYYSTEARVSSQTPPTLLIHAHDDKGVVPDNSIAFYLALLQHKVPAALHIYEGGGHGFSFAEGKGATANWPKVCEDWMKERKLLQKD